MRKHFLILTFVISATVMLMASCSAAELAQMGYRPDYAVSPALNSKPLWRTVVLPPSSASPSQLTQASGLQDYAGMALLRTGKFSLVDRSVIDDLLEEQEFSWSGVVDPSTAVELGRLLGAEAVMTITINSITHDEFWADEPSQRDALLHVKIISVETAEVLYTSSGEGTDFEGAEGALRMALQVSLMGLENGGTL